MLIIYIKVTKWASWGIVILAILVCMWDPTIWYHNMSTSFEHGNLGFKKEYGQKKSVSFWWLNAKIYIENG